MGNFLRKYCSCCMPCISKDKADSYMPDQHAVFENKHVVDSGNRRSSVSFMGGPTNAIVIQNVNNDLYIALYDYKAGTNEELSFNAGDQLKILDTTHESWWVARALNPRGKVEGYIPANYVAPVGSIESKPWFFRTIKRTEAEKQLIGPGNRAGSFLIRESESQKGDYSLSGMFVYYNLF